MAASAAGWSDGSGVISITLFMFSTVIGKALYYWRTAENNSDLEQVYVDEFIRNGVVVIPNLLNAKEVKACREGFHHQLSELGCDPDNLTDTAGALSSVSSTGGAGGILDIFYANWKLALNEHPRIVSAYVKILSSTYAANNPAKAWRHPFGKFRASDVYMYIDRCCFRVPDAVSNLWKQKKKGLQRSLTPHLDCCPHKLYSFEKAVPKWRPIQAFIALTDTLNADEGGFEAAPGLHLAFDDWVANRPPSVQQGSSSDGNDIMTSPPCVGDFTPIRPKEDKFVLDMIKHIPVKAGDVVFWDYRIAHANARRNIKNIAREVVYIGLLPGIAMNKRYAENQLQHFNKGQVPTDQWHEHSGIQHCNYKFTSLGRKMMTIDPY